MPPKSREQKLGFQLLIMTDAIMSAFLGPITNTVPSSTCNIKQLYKFVTSDKRLEEMTIQLRAIPPKEKKKRREKKALLPSVTPLAVFRKRCEAGLITPSGELVIDIDDVVSFEIACQLRDTLFNDVWLKPDFACVSPFGGVKLFVPYCVSPYEPLKETVKHAYERYWSYIESKYGDKFKMKVDRCADLSRACFLCHDAGAKIRM